MGQPGDCHYHACADPGCEICPFTDEYSDEHTCALCKDDYEWVNTNDEKFGYCRYCHDDDFYGYPTCGSRDPGGQGVRTRPNGEVINGCECLPNEVLIDGHCHTCGTTC